MKQILSFIIAGLAATGYAIPFDDSTGAPATVIVNSDGSGDYLSLKEASTAFNAVSGGINRTWTVLIDSDLTEPERIAFGNIVNNDSKLIVKPNTGKTPTITFTATAAPTNADATFGCWLIGANNNALIQGPTKDDLFETNNAFVIDGSNTENGTTRDLTIQNNANEASTHVLRVVGSSHGTVIKNVRVLQLRNSGNAYAISFGAGKVNGFGTTGNFKSDNVLVENCFIQSLSPGGTSSQGIGLFSGIGTMGTLDAGLHFENHVYRNNDIEVKHRGIGVHYIINSIYENNRISVKNTGTGGGSAAIIHLVQNSPTAPYDMTIRNNIIHKLETANITAGSSAGITGIDATIDGGSTARPTYRIYNNVITGFAHTADPSAAASDQVVRGIYVGAQNSHAEIHHNSINIDIPNYKATGATIGRVVGILVGANLGGEVKRITNNLVRVNVGGTNSAAYRSGTGLATLGSGNNFVKNNGGYHSMIVGRYYATLSDLAANETDAPLYAVGGAQSVDPASLSPAWDTNPTAEWPLSFASAPVGLGKADESTIPTDINGVERGTVNVYPGAYAIAKSTVADWSTY